MTMSDELFHKLKKQLADMRSAMSELYNQLDETSDNNYYEIRRIQNQIAIKLVHIDELERGIEVILGKGKIDPSDA
jgi:hypothetical protein